MILEMCCFSLSPDQLATLSLFSESKDPSAIPNLGPAIFLSYTCLSYFMHFSILISMKKLLFLPHPILLQRLRFQLMEEEKL